MEQSQDILHPAGVRVRVSRMATVDSVERRGSDRLAQELKKLSPTRGLIKQLEIFALGVRPADRANKGPAQKPPQKYPEPGFHKVGVLPLVASGRTTFVDRGIRFLLIA